MTPAAVFISSSTALNRVEPWQRRRSFYRRQRESFQRVGRRGLLGQAANTKSGAKPANGRPGAYHCKWNCQGWPSGQKECVGNRFRTRYRQCYQHDSTEQRMRPQIAKSQRKWHPMIIAALPDPPDFPAEHKSDQEDRVAKPEDRAKQNRICGFNDEINGKAHRSAKLTAKISPHQDVDSARDFRRKPH